jgi:hypothetical protein
VVVVLAGSLGLFMIVMKNFVITHLHWPAMRISSAHRFIPRPSARGDAAGGCRPAESSLAVTALSQPMSGLRNERSGRADSVKQCLSCSFFDPTTRRR